MTAPLEGAQIYYTIDGTEPTTASNLYNGAFALENDCTVKAIAVVNDVISPVASIDCKVFKGALKSLSRTTHSKKPAKTLLLLPTSLVGPLLVTRATTGVQRMTQACGPMANSVYVW